MKQKLFGAAALVAFILAGASCSKQEQSEFNLNSVNQEVTITGKVTYSTGVEVNQSNPSNYSVVNSKPASGRKVFIEVAYEQFLYVNPGAAGNPKGNKIFETVTAEDGTFSITIPTKSTGINATIRMEEFTDIYNEYEKMVDGKPVFKQTLRNYTYTVNLNGLKPGSMKFPDEIVYNNAVIDEEQFDESVTMSGNVNLAIETGFRKGEFKPAQKANVEFTISYGAGLTYKFGTTTDAQGNYSITLPVKSLSNGFNITGLKVLGIGDNQFTHYTSDTTSVKIYGAYELMNFGNIPMGGSIALRDIIDGVTYNLGSQNLLFTPYFNAGITDASQAEPENWDANLIGWAAGMDGFDESYDKTVILTGRVLVPALSSFGKGIYKPSEQAIVITGDAPYDYEFTAITGKDGTFSIEIPAKDDSDPNFTIKPKEKKLPFTFIDSEGKQTTYRKGEYDYKTKLRKEDAEWYEFGDVFFKYTVDNEEKTDEWNDYLIGWYVDPEYTDTVKVSGKIKFAYEESYGIGGYEDHNVIVTVRDLTNDRRFAIQTSDGTFDFMMPVENKNSDLNLAVVNATYKTYDYKHYPKYGQDFKLLEGTYTLKSTVYETKEDKNAWNNLGTRYMYISKANLDSDCDTYVDNLAGWFVRTDNNVRMQEFSQATGIVKLAKETGYLEGTMSPASRMLIPVKIENDVIYVLTDNSGNFSLKIYFKNKGDEPNLTIPAAGGAYDITVEDFVHYVNAEGKTKILKGDYQAERIKDADAKWNEYGTIYYKFDPEDAVDNWDTYTKYIAGWVYKKDYNITKTVTGYIKLAKETGYLKGNYQTEQGIPVKIQLDGQADMIFIAMTDANGKYVIDVPVEKEYDEPDVQVLGLGIGDPDDPDDDHGFAYEDFIHYIDAKDATKIRELDGKYFGEQIQVEDHAWNDAGTIYYKFHPKNAAGIDNWQKYFQYTAGWIYKEGLSKTVTGYVKVARETGFLTGDFGSDAKDIEVKIQLDGDDDLIFATTTNAQGKFEIVVPIEDEEDEPNVDVLGKGLNPADGTEFKGFIHYVNAQGKTKKLNGKYKWEQIKSANAEWNDAGTVYYTFWPDNAGDVENWNTYTKFTAGWIYKEDYIFKNNVTGRIWLAKETQYSKGEYGVEKDIPVLIQLDGDLKFAAPTDANGNFSIPVIFENENDEPNVTVLGLGYGVNDGFQYQGFKHFTDTLDNFTSLDGKYKGKQIQVEDHAWQDAGTMYYTFYPADAPDGWNTYNKFTAGWIKNEGLTYPKTVSGVVKIAQETGFLKGDFNANAHFTRVLVKVANSDDRKYMVPVNADGSYQVTIEVEDQYDEPNVQVILNDIEGVKFTDYVNTTKTKKIEGHFEGTNVKEDNTEWANLGTAYYTFEPDAPSDMWTKYTQYTSGWFYKKGYTYPKAVSGSVKLSCETKYWEANWSGPSNGVPVKLFIDVNGNGLWNDGEPYYVTSTDEGGSFSLDVYLQKNSDEPDVVWSAPNITLDELNKYQYLHFTTPGSTSKTKLAGTYNHAGTIKKSGSKWYQLGTRYYRFSPTAAPGSWHDNKLYGITVWPDGFNNKLTVKGAVQKAVEKFTSGAASAEEKWEYVPYAYSTVTIELDGYDYEFNVCAEANGKFTLYVYDNVIPDDLPITVVPDNIEEQLKHWEDKNDIETADMIDGKYVSANNVKKANPIDKSGTNTYDFQTAVPYSAKLIYSPDAAPANWGDYGWDNDGN